ncbi:MULTISPECIES: VOC family protein [Sphingobium]|jgi:catechol 2,3-dioxygenase-like lactoylglutathione lyase family enzyme|uniref:Biphenyl-2,3-diol 1,2-dioxygenase 3 n=1 Tax=Sphingobium fuliginis (strain ATCC 27551) TaxID=336203 RepID=A0A292ZBK8_SPHSA|nr:MULTISPECIES: VOC family protein [Sphingobium]QOT70424.1 VOC family protein [Sphingobium fuliginis]GAY22092.1 biphenyl-2,3-diol 1,2-dioxygenase 3 [Sphingobium fuliginis]
MQMLDERRSEIAAKIVPPSKLAHFVLRTSRFAEMVDWYKLVMHATAAYENPGLSFLSYDEEHHRIAIVAVPDLHDQDGSDVGLHHIAFTYDSLHDLLENYQRLKDLGIAPAWAINHGPTTSLYYRDPDGNHLEFQVENFVTVEESTKFFFTEEFNVNPIGVEFDPDMLRQRMLAGEDETELKRRPASGPVGLDAVKI